MGKLEPLDSVRAIAGDSANELAAFVTYAVAMPAESPLIPFSLVELLTLSQAKWAHNFGVNTGVLSVFGGSRSYVASKGSTS